MREILFRGKRIDNGEWVEGHYCCLGNKYHYILSGVLDITNGYPDLVKNPVIPDTVGQYTGLTDKNGKSIFEGDICQIKNHRLIDETPFVVEWEDFVYNGWIWKDLDENGGSDSFTNGAAKVCEVIGNIHDALELLKGESNDTNT